MDTGTLIARDVVKAHGDGDRAGRRLGDRRARRRARRRRPQRRRQVDAPAHPRRASTRPTAARCTLTAGTAGYLPQEPDRAPGETLEAYLARRTGVAAADARVQAATTRDWPRARPAPRDRYAHAFEAWLALGGADLEPRAEAVCASSASTRALLDLETATLSGGQAARASLAAILLSRFDVLLLDEPTNDLDFDGLARLERFVAERPGGAVIVSHDRAFLERTVTRVLELDEIAHTAAEYGGGWAGYLELRATAARHAEERYEVYTAERDRLSGPRRAPAAVVGDGRAEGQGIGDEPDKNVRRQRDRALGEAGGKVRATEKAIERLDEVDKPWRRWELQLRFGGGERAGDVTARLERAVMRRGDFTLGPLDLELAWGERVALVGPNGSGKTTLVEALLGRLAARARARAGSAPACGRRARPGARAASPAPARCSTPSWSSSGLPQQEARSLLAKFGLGDDAVARPARTLSPGERTRASLALLMASGANWLVLDEPTNHLDLPAIEQLETALGAFDGTLLLVTHDRRLLDAVTLDRTIELGAAAPNR